MYLQYWKYSLDLRLWNFSLLFNTFCLFSVPLYHHFTNVKLNLQPYTRETKGIYILQVCVQSCNSISQRPDNSLYVFLFLFFFFFSMLAFECPVRKLGGESESEDIVLFFIGIGNSSKT